MFGAPVGQVLSTTDDEVDLVNEESKESRDGGLETNLLSDEVFLHLLSLLIWWLLGVECEYNGQSYLLEPEYR